MPPGCRSARTAAPSTPSTGRRRRTARTPASPNSAMLPLIVGSDPEPARARGRPAAGRHRRSRPARQRQPAATQSRRRELAERRRQARRMRGAGCRRLTRCYDRSAMTARWGGTARSLGGIGGGPMALAALREWRLEERAPGSGPARSDHAAAEPAAVPGRRRLLGQRPRHAGAGHAGRAAGLQRNPPRARPCPLGCLHPRRGARGWSTSSGPGRRSITSTCSSFAFRLPGHAEPDPPAMIDRIVAGFREPILCDDVPIDTRIGIGLKAMGAPAAARARTCARRCRPRRTAAARARAGPGSTARRDDAHRRAFRLLSDLKHALDAEGQLELHYQPKVTLDTGACASAEALLRWTHPAARAGLARRVRRAGRDDRAGHADDPLGDRRGDPAGGDLAARGPRPVASRSTSRRRTSRSRTSSSTCCSAARRAGSTRRGSSSRSPRGSAPRAAG